ncbi:MAG: hypothetical protein L0I24_09200, partial [Pseudonocardia sp.]|nr:hypothetical protein [Pseudonocardia sp.]
MSRNRRSGRAKPGGGVAAQIALARRESPHRGAGLTTTALCLTRDLPHTLAALTRGLINEYRAELIVRGVNHLHPDQRAIIDEQVIGAAGPDVAGWGNRQVEHRIRAEADRLAAAAAT